MTQIHRKMDWKNLAGFNEGDILPLTGYYLISEIIILLGKHQGSKCRKNMTYVM